MQCKVTLTTYGEITLVAVKNVGKGHSHADAWNNATQSITGKASKPCARAAFIGLCRAGIVRGEGVQNFV